MKSRRALTAGFGATMLATTVLFVSSAPPAFTQAAQSSLAGYTDPVQCAVSCKLIVSFTVPSVHCPSANTQMALFGGRFITVPQLASTSAKAGVRLFPLDMQGGVIAGCNGINTPVFKTLYQFTGATSYGKVPFVGDSMTVILNVATPLAVNGATIKIHDNTQSWTQTVSGETAGGVSSVLAGLKAFGCVRSGACLPVPEFASPVQFSVSFNGVQAQDPPWQPLSVSDLASVVEASSSAPPLSPAGRFSVSWVTSCSPVAGGQLC